MQSVSLQYACQSHKHEWPQQLGGQIEKKGYVYLGVVDCIRDTQKRISEEQNISDHVLDCFGDAMRINLQWMGPVKRNEQVHNVTETDLHCIPVCASWRAYET